MAEILLESFQAAQAGDYEKTKQLIEYSKESMNAVDSNGRNILHYAAESGNVELCKYLVERVGMDIGSADKNLVTPYEIAYESKHNSLLKYFEEKFGAKYEHLYHNPIRRGFFPDPSVVCVGDDFYMVNSTFVFFPCIPISHSKDLVHWEIIGHAITNPEWAMIGDLDGGRGYWAPDISYDNGRFYIAATLRGNGDEAGCRKQIVVSSDKPEGPYSKPVIIDEDGIDPSIFHENGRHYMLLNRGARIFELDETCTKKISEPRLLYYGYHKRNPEGPHLLKKDGYYYLFLAEGGTGMGHRVTVARSKEIDGIYEPCPYNPIMRQDNPDAPIQRAGHGKPVKTPSGEWYMVYLCGRIFDEKYSMLGRETALDKIEWTMDGWPIVNSLNGPSNISKMPMLPIYEADQGLNEKNSYLTAREPENGWLTYEDDEIILKGSPAPLSSVDSRNLYLKRQSEFVFSTSVVLEKPDLSEKQEAGMTFYYDENSWVNFYLAKEADQYRIVVMENIGQEIKEAASVLIDSDFEEIKFKVNVCGLEREFLYEICSKISAEHDMEKSDKYHTLCKLDNVFYLSDEGVKMGKRFTGALYGIYAYRGDGVLNARFKKFMSERLA